jgi:Protein of unknown function (DUF559)
MRVAPTPSEQRLWALLRAGQLGVWFRRQVPLGRFIADFAAVSARVVVEVDGGYHARRRAADARRDRALARLGYRVLRLEAGVGPSAAARSGRTGSRGSAAALARTFGSALDAQPEGRGSWQENAGKKGPGDDTEVQRVVTNAKKLVNRVSACLA